MLFSLKTIFKGIYCRSLINRSMSVLTQSFNVTSGKMEWEFQPENYDWHQEVARSGYADMLHDKERNHKYYNGLKVAIAQLKHEGKVVKVLDIGTGTGLLSMMAVKCGADSVIACEAFEPVAKCAMEIIESNGMADKIKLVHKRSTELEVGKGCDLEERANVLVTEVFDTELIGEGALSTFKHALENLLEADCKVIPSSAKVYAQVIESESILDWSRARKLQLAPDNIISIPENITECPGAAGVHDIQMSQLQNVDFKAITNPVVVHELDFTGTKPLTYKGSTFTETVSLVKGKCQAVFMWWDIEMTPGGETLSCAPYWAHPNPSELQWRDHWMQAIYYLPIPLTVQASKKVVVGLHHDEYSYWFSTQKETNIEHPICICGLHGSYSRTRIAMMNDEERWKRLLKVFRKLITPESTCLILGENIPLALIVCKLGAKKVIVGEPNRIKRDLLQNYLETNNLEGKAIIMDKDPLNLTSEDTEEGKIDVLLAEPYFTSSVVPWDNIHFWYLRSTLKLLLAPDAKIAPLRGVIRGVAVELKDLWKIRAPVGHVEGFDLTIFDDMVQSAIEISDAEVEPHPLWEYPGTALSDTFNLFTFDFTADVSVDMTEMSHGTEKFKSAGVCNAIVMWMEYQFDEEERISNGPSSDIKPGNVIEWYRHSMQGVFFIKNPVQIDVETHSIKYENTFRAKSGTTEFKFTIEQ